MATIAFIANGATRNWSSSSSWVGGVVPTAADDVVFPTNLAGSSLVVDGTAVSPSVCRSMDCTGYTQIVNLSTNKYLFIGDSGGGSLTLTAGMTFGGGGQVNFVSTTTGNTITTAGHTLNYVVFDGPGGGWTLQDSLTTVSNNEIHLLAGSLDDGGQTVSTGLFLSRDPNTRALTISGSWTCGWDIRDSTGMTLTATGSVITSELFFGGSLTYEDLILAQGTPAIYGDNTFTNVTYTGAAVKHDSVMFGGDQTITGTLTINGNSSLNRILIKSDAKGATRTITAAAVAFTNADFQDIVGAGAANWNLSAITGLSGDCGGCSGITFTSPINCYMKTTTSVAWSAANWYTTSGGSTPARVPLPQDTAIFDANSFTIPTQISVDVIRIPGMDWTGALYGPTLQNAAFSGTVQNLSIFGNVILIAGMTTTNTGIVTATVTFESRGSINFDGGTGNTWGLGIIIQDGPGGTVNLVNDLDCGGMTITSGTWNNGSYDVTALLLIDGGTLNLGSGTVTYSGVTVSGGTLEMNGNSMTTGGVLISGGTVNLSGLIDSSSDIDVSGGTINDTGPAGELASTGNITFSGGTATVRTITAPGLNGNIIQSGTSTLTITGGASWGENWEMDGTGFTFTTAGVPTWSGGILTVSGSGGGGAGSWTFC